MFNLNSQQKMMINNSLGNNIMVMGDNNFLNAQIINNWDFCLKIDQIFPKYMNGMYTENKNNNNTYNSEVFFERGEQYRRYIINPGNIINIKFKASSGPVVMISIDKVRPLKDLFKEYANIIGIPEFLLGKEVIFIFNSRAIDVHDENIQICNFFGLDLATIAVFELKQIIGANN